MRIRAKHDKLIDILIADARYMILPTGQIFRDGRELGYTKKCEAKHRNVMYKYLKYKGVEIKIHRAIYRKFVGELKRNLVVHHRDANSLNNAADNLELTTQRRNVQYIYDTGDNLEVDC